MTQESWTQKLRAVLKALYHYLKTGISNYLSKAPQRRAARLQKDKEKLISLRVKAKIKEEEAKIAKADSNIRKSKSVGISKSDFSSSVVNSASSEPKDFLEPSDYWK